MTIIEGILGFGGKTAKDFLSGVGKEAGKDFYESTKKTLKRNFKVYSPHYAARLRDGLFRIAQRQKIEAKQKGRKRSLSINRPMETRLLTKGVEKSNFKKLSDIYDFWHEYGKQKHNPAGVDNFLASCMPIGVEATIEKIKQAGGWRALVHAPGGFGKTSFLLRLTELALQDKGIVPVFFDLAKRPKFEKDLTFDKFVQAYSIDPTFTAKNFVDILAYAVAMDQTVLVIVDGVNQESRYSWDKLREFIHMLSQGCQDIGFSILICDRMNERHLEEHDYEITTIAPLSQKFIKDRLSSKMKLNKSSFNVGWFDILDTPLFLGLAEKSISNNESPSRAGLIENYILETVEVVKNIGMGPLTKAAYLFYEKAKHTEIDIKDFKSLLGNEILYSALETAGVISVRNVKKPLQTLVGFFHQTIHDYLAARYLVDIEPREARSKWTGQAFDSVSLNQSSYDALELAAEHISRQVTQPKNNEVSDSFVRQAYNWSLPGTLQIVSRLHHLGRKDILSQPLLWALYAVNMERKFDPFQHAVDKASEFFEEILPPDAEAAWQNNTNNLNTLITFISNHSAFESVGEDDYWKEWMALFKRMDIRTKMKDLLYLSADPLLGWTSSNVFRRNGCEPDEDVLEAALLLYNTSRSDAEQEGAGAIFRWRIVHMLGRSTNTKTIEFLLDVACDNGSSKMLPEYPMTRYGALRSYLEATNLEKNFNQRLTNLARRISRVLEGEGHHRIRIQKLLKSKPLFVETPDGWDNSYQPVLGVM